MANVWNECTATGGGERDLAEHLASFEDRHLHLFFSIGFIPGAREIDLLLVHELVGVFIIEVKALGIEGLVSVSPNEWIIEGRDTKENPVLQAYQQYEGLRDFLSPHYRTLPFVAVTACLPKIKRHRWVQAFGHAMYAEGISQSVIFEEDLFSGLPAFLDRLSYIHANPPVRQGRNPSAVKPEFLRLLRDLVQPAHPQVATISDREKLRAIENGITAELQKEFPAEAASHAIFTGGPGTGKTFRLLSIGAFHSYNGKRVLFVCFNKTLAADIRRLLSFSDRLQLTRHRIEILDINQLALRCFEMNGIGFIDSRDADQWGEILVEQLRGASDPQVQKYDTILIDEAQDMKVWQLDLLECHSMKMASVVIALGQGQELYRDAASAAAWLQTFSGREQIMPIKLRRNFRNQRQQYCFAEAFVDAWPIELSRIERCVKRILMGRRQEVMFDRVSGEPPKLHFVPVDIKEFDDHGRYQDEIFADTLLPILRQEVEDLRSDANLHPASLLVLVPSKDGLHARAARIALDKLCDGTDLGYLDYTKEESRRASAAPDQFLFCTFHSARGLEGERVVVLGLEGVANIADAAHAKPENLAFIALSRGIFSTTIVVRATPRNNVHELCERILQAIAKSEMGVSRTSSVLDA